ncbi:PTS fructose transporter subunit IIABC [Anaeromicropila populeti]|uniref:PTS system, fructose-specific IIC component n=1 Tax=Anaeromicropila populeti TaxID=37658 RepID=A0A1I6IS36_9FIRM|nr:fructose-specific PTS transporter subunit EIIC [Anaeromicropila populeti]SFR69542.1 PTS system D-fructose-specific IIA component (F1P-forming), Frc family (TC 4.A.2.1.4)/PTS system D-fructose-specific IIB component (F1P-forming), Frc family (TC 4.A.2.1.4)/PTS system D-fructose-specific IIC component (F1P-forming), Frc family (TC 4.A.2.1.4) [Anaeromicropila populeti]
MRITDLLDKRSIELNGRVSTKKEALDKVIDLMAASGKLKDKEAYRKKVYAREEEGTTGIGEGIAIPHGKGDAVLKPGLAAMVIKNGVDFESLDGEPVHIIFLIAAPNTKDNVHLDVLSKLSVLMMNDDFTRKLRNAKSVDEFLKIIDSFDEEGGQSKVISYNNQNSCKILAVTACPTGIAHTYMAAEALEKKAGALGCSIKVETRGSGGAKNVLTDAEIAEADCIIVAADTKVPMGRFNGKKLIECQVSDGINKAEELVKRAMSGNVPVYLAKAGSSEEGASAGSGSVGHSIYKHLMSGVSHMLPFVVGGGILIAIAFLIDSMLIDMSALDPEVRSSFGSITKYAAFFMTIGGTAFKFMLPILAGFIALSIADRPGLALGFVGGSIAASGSSGFLGALVAGFLAGYTIVLLRKIFEGLPEALDGLKPVLLYPLFGILIVGTVMVFIVEPPVGALNTLMNNGLLGMNNTSKIILGMVLGGMMSVDLGGPVNKAAYVFGTASIAAGNYAIMAAVMVGGMVPPCIIALATLLFKNKFTREERKSGPTNFVMGLAFISEGAIPFAAADPLRVLPSCIVGSAIAGALSMAFGCTLMAPHGGIFVFPVVGNALLYLLALVIGTVVGAVMLGLLKKPVEE